MQLREPLPTQHEQTFPVIGLQSRTMFFLDSLFLPTIMYALLIPLTLLTTAFVPTFVLMHTALLRGFCYQLKQSPTFEGERNFRN